MIARNRTPNLFLSGLFAVSLALAATPVEHPRNTGGVPPIPELDCVIRPSEVVDVGSAVPGVIETIYVDRSDLVKKGAVIAKFESSVEIASLELARDRASLNTAIELRRQSARFGHLTQRRNQSLLQQSAISMQDMDRLKSETRIAELQVQQERDNKRIAELEYRRARAVLERRTIGSPVDGVIMERFKSVGEYVEDEPILRVAQLDPLHVEVIVPVDYLGRIAPGMQARVTALVPGAAAYLATVERVDRVADAASGTYGVRLSLPNPEYKIPAGLRCRGQFLPQRHQPQTRTVTARNEARTSKKPAESPKVAAQEEVPASKKPAAPPEVAVLGIDEPEKGSPATKKRASEPASKSSLPASANLNDACYSIGPIRREAQARQISNRLEAYSDKLAIRHESVSRGTRYLILALPEPDRQATRALLTRLKAAGRSDSYVLSRGRFKGRVSLGYYRDRNIAHADQQQFTAQGFATELVPVSRKTTRYWLDIALKTGNMPPDRVGKIRAALPPSVSLEPGICRRLVADR